MKPLMVPYPGHLPARDLLNIQDRQTKFCIQFSGLQPSPVTSGLSARQIACPALIKLKQLSNERLAVQSTRQSI